MAGDSKIPGKVCAGFDADGTLLGFPLSYIAGMLTMSEKELDEVLILLERQGRIEKLTDPRNNFVIVLTGWEKYQSEYHRQKSYRSANDKVTTEVTSETTPKLPVEGEVEGEEEVEEESPPAPVSSISPEDQEPKQASDRDLANLWSSMRRVYKHATAKSLGTSVRGSYGEKFRELVSHHGQDKVLAGFTSFVENKGKKFLRTLSTPIFLFMKEAETWIDDAQIEPEKESDSWEKKMPLA